MLDQKFLEEQLSPGWKKLFNQEFKKSYFINIEKFIDRERDKGHLILPQPELIFNAFIKTPLENVKVVIVGQDPYHHQTQPHGLSFSVQEGVKLPPSLRNIFKELKNDLVIDHFASGSLANWAKQGVLLLNATLTVNEGQPNSHKDAGWELFTNFVIETLANREDPVIFVLWGAFAQKKIRFIKRKEFVLMAAHPSPFSAHTGFFGSAPFSRINQMLKGLGKKEIDWSL